MPDDKIDNPDMDKARMLPSQLREDIGATFSRVLSDDPTVKVPATRSFMAQLQTAMILNGEQKYDGIIQVHTLNAIDAVAAYASDNWAAAVEICYKIQADLGFLVYCGYGTSDGKAFSIPVIPLEKAVKK
jgi:hypothetical protein